MPEWSKGRSWEGKGKEEGELWAVTTGSIFFVNGNYPYSDISSMNSYLLAILSNSFLVVCSELANSAVLKML